MASTKILHASSKYPNAQYDEAYSLFNVTEREVLLFKDDVSNFTKVSIKQMND